MELAGQVALVTGAGRGIGAVVAIALAQAGANVAVNDLTENDNLRETARQVAATGRRALITAGDVADYDAVEGMIAAAVQEFGRLDIAVSNAAFSDREPFHSANLAGFRRTVDVTMWGAFNTLALPRGKC